MGTSPTDIISCSAIRYYKNGKESIHITGASAGKTIQLNFDKIDTLTKGVYSIAATDTIVLSSYTNLDGSFNSQIGQVTIFSYNKDTIKGAFSYEAEQFGIPVIVSSQFSVKVKDIPPPIDTKITLNTGGTNFDLSCNVVSNKKNHTFTINGTNSDNSKTIAMSFSTDNPLGLYPCNNNTTLTYNLGTSPSMKTYLCDGSVGNNDAITISSNDGKSIQGTFSVTVYNIKNSVETLSLTGDFSSSSISTISK